MKKIVKRRNAPKRGTSVRKAGKVAKAKQLRHTKPARRPAVKKKPVKRVGKRPVARPRKVRRQAPTRKRVKRKPKPKRPTPPPIRVECDDPISQQIFDRSVISYMSTLHELGGGRVMLRRDDEKKQVSFHYLQRLITQLSNEYNEDAKTKRDRYPMLILIDFCEDTGDVILNFDETEFPYKEYDGDLRDVGRSGHDE